MGEEVKDVANSAGVTGLLPEKMVEPGDAVLNRENRLFGDETMSDELTQLLELDEQQINNTARLIGVTDLRDGVKDTLTLIAAASVGMLAGGVGQIITEQPTAYVNGVLVEKFPDGMNLAEEFLEGGVAMSAGVVLGELLYRALIAKTGIKPESGGRSMMWMFGSMTTYLGMFFYR